MIHLQRIGVIIGAIIVIVSMFFPWVKLGLIFPKTPAKLSWIVAGVAVVAILLALIGDKKTKLPKATQWIIALLGFGIAGLGMFFIGKVWRIIPTAGVHKKVFMTTVSEKEGLYILIIGGGIVSLSALLAKKKALR